MAVVRRVPWFGWSSSLKAQRGNRRSLLKQCGTRVEAAELSLPHDNMLHQLLCVYRQVDLQHWLCSTANDQSQQPFSTTFLVFLLRLHSKQLIHGQLAQHPIRTGRPNGLRRVMHRRESSGRQHLCR